MSSIKKNSFYEETLPEGYREAKVVDSGDSRLRSRFTIAAIVLDIVIFCAIWFFYVSTRTNEVVAGISTLKCIGFIALYMLYIFLHELTHGLVYKLLTKKKLVFGFEPRMAYCGVPGIYAYRKTALMSVFAPLIIFSIVFTAAFFIANEPFVKMMFLLMLGLHITGCIGDMYNIGLLLFRFRKPTTLRKDTGPTQIYYVKD